MGEVINLTRFRKRKARATAAAEAAEQRARFGLTQDQKAKDVDAAERAARALDEKKIED